jgi:hypothetical protein
LEIGLRDSRIPPFDVVTGEGHWMGLTVRITGQGQALVVVAFNSQNMNNLQVSLPVNLDSYSKQRT